MSSSIATKAKRDENRAMREYLELYKTWVFDLYTNHGVRFNELHRALVHYRQPWVDAPRLRSAIERWKKNAEPRPWPSQQIPETPGFIIPPPPLAPPNLLNRLRVLESVPNVASSSMTMTMLLNHPNQEDLRNADPSNSTPTPTMTPGLLMPMPSNQTLGALTQNHGTQWQQPTQASVDNFVFQPQYQATVLETTDDDFMNNAGYRPDKSIWNM